MDRAKSPTGTKKTGLSQADAQAQLDSFLSKYDPEVLALINVDLNRAKVPMPAGARRKLIIRSVSAKQRPRRIARPT